MFDLTVTHIVFELLRPNRDKLNQHHNDGMDKWLQPGLILGCNYICI